MVISKCIRVAVLVVGMPACRTSGRSQLSPTPNCPANGAADTTATGIPRTQYCGPSARAELARLVRAMPADTARDRLRDIVSYTVYPDAHILDAALTVASSAATT